MDWIRLNHRFSLSLKNTLELTAILVFVLIAFAFFIPTKHHSYRWPKKKKHHSYQYRRDSNSDSDSDSKTCNFPAIFNFGDSNSDTGGKSAAFHRLPSPNGNTFFGKPSGRYSDGKVILDFIAENLGLPYISAYLDSINTNFRHGANFATGGSTVQPVDARIFEAGFSPISLDLQLLQFEQFKARALELYNEGRSSYVESSLPRPEDFSKALYTMDIGQNDIHFILKAMTEKQALASIPKIIDQFARAVKQLYQNGARAFWIHNTGPIGCLPYDVIFYHPRSNDMDQNGCGISHNKIAQEYNRQLKDLVSSLRFQFSDAALNYIDIYSAKYTLISEAEKHGFVSPLEYCCGHYGDYHVQCGKKAIVNGTEIFGSSCGDPLKVINWDGIHYSHAANQWVANRILDGSLSDLQLPITKSCYKPTQQ